MTDSSLGKLIDRMRGKRAKEIEEKAEEKGIERKEEAQAPSGAQTPMVTGKIYLKALSLRSLDDLERIKSEVKSGNIVIIRVEPLAEKSIEDVKRAIGELSEFVGSIGGDIARLGEERIVVTPPTVQIWREKQQSSSTDIAHA